MPTLHGRPPPSTQCASVIGRHPTAAPHLPHLPPSPTPRPPRRAPYLSTYEAMLQSARASSEKSVGPWMTNESRMLQAAQNSAEAAATIVVEEYIQTYVDLASPRCHPPPLCTPAALSSTTLCGPMVHVTHPPTYSHLHSPTHLLTVVSMFLTLTLTLTLTYSPAYCGQHVPDPNPNPNPNPNLLTCLLWPACSWVR